MSFVCIWRKLIKSVFWDFFGRKKSASVFQYREYWKNQLNIYLTNTSKHHVHFYRTRDTTVLYYIYWLPFEILQSYLHYVIDNSNQGAIPKWSYKQIEYNGEEIIEIMNRYWLNLTVTLQITYQNQERIGRAVSSCLTQENVFCPNIQNTSLAGNFGPQIRLPDGHFGQFRAIGPMGLFRPDSGWSSTWFHSNTGLSSTQYEQIPIIFGVWPFWLTPFFFRSITFWWVYGQIVFHLLKLLFLLADILLQQKALFRCKGFVKWLQIHDPQSFSPIICQFNGCPHFCAVLF